MNLPSIIDADDVGIIAKGVVLFALASAGVLGIAATLGLAWLVFRLAGGI